MTTDRDRTLDVGVVIVTYNSEDAIAALVRSMEVGLAGLAWDGVVIDNDSHDGTLMQLQSCGMRVIQMGFNAGYAAAINRGVQQFPTARSVLVLNPDVALVEHSVSELLAGLDDPLVGVTIPQMRDFAGNLAFTQRRTPSLPRALGPAVIGGERAMRFAWLSEMVANEHDYLAATDVAWGVGAVFLIARACIDAVGDWDESFFLYSEETDYCHRALTAGFRTRYIPTAIAYHEGGGGVNQPRLRSMMVINKVRHYSRLHRAPAAWLFYSAVVLNEAIRAMMGNDAAKAATFALLMPARRPPEIACSTSRLPR